MLLLLAGGLRFARIDQPTRLMFDEKHYVPDAREYLSRGVEIERPAHPPAGKWLMAAAIRVAGDRPIGWRLAPAISGVVAVAATYLMGLTLFRRRWPAAMAALLLAVDGMALTMSRIGMLDGIQAAFVAVGALFSLWDWHADHRRWRWACGLVFGVALAVKWSSGLALAMAVVIAVIAEVREHKRTGGPGPVLAAARVVLPLAVVPVAVYVASYAGWFANVDRSESGRERCQGDCSITETASAWAFEQRDMWDLQSRLKTTHPDRSRPLAWLTMADPVLYYAEGCVNAPPEKDCAVAPGKQARIVGVGNLALWWTALPIYAYLAWAAVRRRRGAAAFILAFISAQVLPWFASWKPGFAFYLAPVAPFVALAVAAASLDAVSRWRRVAVLPVGVAVAAVALAVWFYPVWTGMELSPSALDARLWFSGWR